MEHTIDECQITRDLTVLWQLHSQVKDVVIGNLQKYHLYYEFLKSNPSVEMYVGMLQGLACLRNEEAIMAGEWMLDSRYIDQKYGNFIKQTFKDLLGRRGVLRDRQEIPGLQLPTFEACELAWPDYDWSHIRDLHLLYNWIPMGLDQFLSHVGRYVCPHGKGISIFGKNSWLKVSK